MIAAREELLLLLLLSNAGEGDLPLPFLERLIIFSASLERPLDPPGAALGGIIVMGDLHPSVRTSSIFRDSSFVRCWRAARWTRSSRRALSSQSRIMFCRDWASSISAIASAAFRGRMGLGLNLVDEGGGIVVFLVAFGVFLVSSTVLPRLGGACKKW